MRVFNGLLSVGPPFSTDGGFVPMAGVNPGFGGKGPEPLEAPSQGSAIAPR